MRMFKGIAIAFLALSMPVLAQAGATAPGTNATEQSGAASSTGAAKMPAGGGHGDVGTANDGSPGSMDAKKPKKMKKAKKAKPADDTTAPAAK
jgi:hypothetical protein